MRDSIQTKVEEPSFLYKDISFISLEPLHVCLLSEALSDLHIEFPPGVTINLEVAEAIAQWGTPADVLREAIRGEYSPDQLKMYDAFGKEEYRFWKAKGHLK